MKGYDDIIRLPRHVSDHHRHMSMENRAAQFAPFAALNGHEEAIEETARLTDGRIELTREEQEEINRRLTHVQSRLEEHPRIAATWFVEDLYKEGGSYRTHSGEVRKIDAYQRALVLVDGERIPMDALIALNEE